MMRSSKVMIGILQHVVRCQQRGIASFGGRDPSFARRMLRPDCLKFTLELGHVRSEGSVGALENLKAFLGGIQLGSEIEVLLF